MTQKEKQETIRCFSALADYYWQSSLYYRSRGDILRQKINREIADTYHNAAQIVKNGPDKIKVIQTTGELNSLKYGEIPEEEQPL